MILIHHNTLRLVTVVRRLGFMKSGSVQSNMLIGITRLSRQMVRTRVLGVISQYVSCPSSSNTARKKGVKPQVLRVYGPSDKVSLDQHVRKCRAERKKMRRLHSTWTSE